MKVLVTRTDRLGDLVLSLPVWQLLKQARPDWELHAMVAPATVPVVANDPHIERVWTWHDGMTAAAVQALEAELAAENFAASVMLQYRGQLAAVLRRAGVRWRYGPLSKWSSWLRLNRGQRQNRSAGDRHEMDFNLDLARRLLADHHCAVPVDGPCGPQIHLDTGQQRGTRNFRTEFGVGGAAVVLIHPGSGGSALDWEPERFAAVANRLAGDPGQRVFVTGGEPDTAVVQQVAANLDPAVTVLLGRYDLGGFLAVLAAGDLFIGPSTGPLHLAAALGVPTLGLFPPVRTMHPDRWGARSFAVTGGRDLVPDVSCPARRHCRLERCAEYSCMDRIPVDATLAAARGILQETGAGQPGRGG